MLLHGSLIWRRCSGAAYVIFSLIAARDLLGAPHYVYDAVHVVYHYHALPGCDALVEQLAYAAFDVRDYLLALRAGKRGAELGQVAVKQGIGVFVYIENLAVDIGRKCFFHSVMSVWLRRMLTERAMSFHDRVSCSRKLWPRGVIE